MYVSSKEYMKAYRKRNRNKINIQTQAWKKANHERFRQQEREHYHTPEGKAKHNARTYKTPKVVLSKALSTIKSHFTKPTRHDPKIGDPRHAFDLNDQYILDLWNKQEGKCAMTNIPMTHERHDLAMVSIDRIDSTKGHIKGNVQLVCQWVNFAKKHYSNESLLKLLDRYYNIRKADES